MFTGVLFIVVEKDVSWMSIPAGPNIRKHGWRDVVSCLLVAGILNALLNGCCCLLVCCVAFCT